VKLRCQCPYPLPTDPIRLVDSLAATVLKEAAPLRPVRGRREPLQGGCRIVQG